MQFCPRCGGLMIPVKREDGKVVLRCTRCGYTMTVESSQLRDYTIVGATPKEERTITTLKVSEAKRKPPKSLEEWEQERDEYKEVLQELLQEELEGEE
ncbi:RNA polymerase [Pyrodictium occultum]|uniref:RNA polymerase n=1 Tax=Pyrodictium occultum TaxID=2309 RepID=A0A0V8RTL2_PYROC|nr:RNA polymerase [Pyrodictium occultum]KSW11399.1 RNA polymerase [Pyrodictium occultum]